MHQRRVRGNVGGSGCQLITSGGSLHVVSDIHLAAYWWRVAAPNNDVTRCAIAFLASSWTSHAAAVFCLRNVQEVESTIAFYAVARAFVPAAILLLLFLIWARATLDVQLVQQPGLTKNYGNLKLWQATQTVQDKWQWPEDRECRVEKDLMLNGRQELLSS